MQVPRDLISGPLWKEEGWQDIPPGRASTDQGDDWLAAAPTAGVLVPSALIPEEHNLLLNPSHPDFAQVKISATSSFSFDPRLQKPTV